MREKIYSLAKGQFVYKSPKLIVRPDTLDVKVTAGESVTLSFTVSNERGTKIKGFGSSYDKEVTFAPLFEGSECELTAVIDTGGHNPGETIEGELNLVTDHGECKVPYKVNIITPVLRDDEKEIRDYFALTKRIQDDPRAGLRLFRDPAFRQAFLYRDEQGQIVYDKLLKGQTPQMAMEEFLVAMGKKAPVRFEIKHPLTTEGEPVYYELEGSDIEDEIRIRLNEWGGAIIRITPTADFIEPAVRTLWTDEFLDGKASLPYTIIAGKVPSGKRYGSLIFESPYERREIEIVVHSPVDAKSRKIERAKKAVQAMLLHSFIADREGLIAKDEYSGFLWKHRNVIEKMEHKYSTPVRGYMALVLGSESSMLAFYRDTERDEKPGSGSPAIDVENYILNEYIKYCYSKRSEDKERLRDELYGYWEGGYRTPFLLLVKTGVDDENYSLQRRADDIRQMLKISRSALLLSELMCMYRDDVELIHTLDSVNLRTFIYGLKHDLLNEDIAVTISYLAEGKIGISSARDVYGRESLTYGDGALLLQLLFGLYKRYALDDTLRSICALLIRHEKQQKSYFPWFEMGVARRMRLTELYEYYMYTVDMDKEEELPESVLSYFQFENHLSDSRKSYLYVDITKNRDKRPDVYKAYELTIDVFIRKQLARGRISKHLGYLYADRLTSQDIDETMAVKACDALFSYELICHTHGMESVTVVHMQTSSVRSYPIKNGRAIIHICTPEYRLFFTDADGYMHLDSVEYEINRLLDRDDLIHVCYENWPEDTPVSIYLTIYMARMAERRPNPDDGMVEILIRALDEGELNDGFYARIYRHLYDHAGKYHDKALMLSLIDRIRPDTIGTDRMGDVITTCIKEGRYDTAEKLLINYGYDTCDQAALARLLSDRLSVSDELNMSYMKWAMWLYQTGCEDRDILRYLLRYFMGDTDTLSNLYRKVFTRIASDEIGMRKVEDEIKLSTFDKEFGERSAERLLGQVLFADRISDEYVSLFLDYYENGKNRVLVKAFLSKLAYEYIVDRGGMSGKLFSKILRQARYEKEPVMVLSALKYMSERKGFDDKETEFVETALEECVSAGYVMAFMKDFEGKVLVPYDIKSSEIVQWFSGTVKKVYLCKASDDGTDEELSLLSASDITSMREVFDGIYVSKILLFEGEKKRYYIYEDEYDTRSDVFEVKRTAHSVGEDSFFSQINAMIRAKDKGDEARYDTLRTTYERQIAVADKLFKVL